MKLRVRCKGLINSLSEGLASTGLNPPPVLLQFLAGLISPGSHAPDGFFLSYELERLSLNSYGAFSSNLSQVSKRMVLGMYLLIKIIVARILLNPGKSGFGGGGTMKLGDRSLRNFKIIASVLTHATLDYLDDITNGGRRTSEPGAVPEFGDHLCTRQEVGPVYMSAYTVSLPGQPPRKGDFHREMLDAIHGLLVKFSKLVEEAGKQIPADSRA